MATLSAHTAVYRVVEILWATADEHGRARQVTGRVGYRWTLAGATRLRDRWARAQAADGGPHMPGAGWVIQGGIVHWVPDDEWDTALDATEWNRDQNIDDRAEHGPSVTWTRPGGPS